MSQAELLQEIEALRERISKLSAASLRISASLDLDTVLQEVVDRARELTGARYGAIITMDKAGLSQEFVTSGLTVEEHRKMADWPEGLRLFEHFRNIQGTLQLPDVPAYLRSLGISTDRLPAGAVKGQGTSMRYRGLHVGNFFLAKTESGEAFTSEDEEVLVLFASQAATAIANALAHRAEQRARADLEALIETSPIGVVVFDAGTGHPTWFNREAGRIVEGLRTPGRPAEELLEMMILRRADGSEIALDQAPMSQILSHTETVRAEEIELSVPDGRSVSTLVNTTPIRAEDGAVVSVVVTMQDMKPLQELDRMRTEFVGMVSHELRAPLTSIKGSAATLLEASRDLDPAEMREFYRIILTQADHMRVLISDLLDAGRIDAGTLSVAPEPSEAAALVDGARRTFQSGGGRHEVLIDLPPDLPLVMADRQRIEQVLNNLFSNAALHAPESTPIRVRAERDGTHVAITVRDEGRGVAPDRLPHLFRKYAGFDGGDRETAIAGSGLGLAICKGLVEANGGRIWAESPGIGHGTRVTFTIPLAEGHEPAPREPAPREPVPADARSNGAGREQTRILVVDDDPQTLRYVRDMLVAGGYDALGTGDHAGLSGIIKDKRPDLVLLDLLLTGTDGIQLMESVPALAELPVIFISANGRDETIAKALDTGAADYLVKPFSETELLARIRTALRRRAETEPFVLGDLTIDYDQRLVSVAGVRLALTAIEYDLLRALALNAGRVSTFDDLIRQIWSNKPYANRKLVRAFIKKLRRKLGDEAGKPRYILNERGIGYRMGSPGDP